MNPRQINQFFEEFEPRRLRTIVIIDYANVEKWKNSLGWKVGVRQLAGLVKHFTTGSRYLRRFYYGADYGKSEKSTDLVEFSRSILEQADAHSLQVVQKRVKYIHSQANVNGFEKKCDLDVEMTVDLIRERDNYDTIVLFSGDGDLAYAVNYLHNEYGKECIVFGARDHVGREIFDAKNSGSISHIFFAEDFESRLARK
ncbi:MAG: NYN domain-containing protein [Candidatus Saccharimonadales bacterium]